MDDMARPKTIEKTDIERIFDLISEGMSVREAVKKEGISNLHFLRLISRDDELGKQYAKAMGMRADALFEECLVLADEGTEDIQRDKLRIDTRKWVVSRMNPRKYGDKLETVLNGGDTPIGMALKIEYIN
jgi:hypothetical protein